MDITNKEGYEVMLHFLANWYELTNSEDLTEILSLGEYVEDGIPADSAMWDYWQEAIKKLRKEGPIYKELS